MTSGFAIPTAQAFGARDLAGVRRSVATGTLLTGAASLVLTVAAPLLAGPVLALLRTPDVWMYESRSRDGGRTWMQPRPSKLQGHNAPAALWRLGNSRDVLAVWDNSSSHRWPLAAAISTDDCRSWSKPKTLTNPVGTQASYPSATQASDGTLIAVWQQDRPDKKGRDLWIARFSRAWVME